MAELISHTLADGRTLAISEPRKEDARRIHVYVERVAGETDFLSFGPGDSGKTVSDLEKGIDDMAKAPNEIALMAGIGGEIAGYLTFKSDKKPRLRHQGEFGVTVARDFWGLGIGKKLIQCLIQWARACASIRKINLIARSDNVRAIEMYKKRGFALEGTITRDLRVADTYHDSVLMGLKINRFS